MQVTPSNMVQRILGIDPGAGGGIALVSGGKLVVVAAMPVTITGKTKTKTGKRRIDAVRLSSMVRGMRPDLAYIELVGPMPRDGSAGSFWFGKAAGIPEGICAALGVPCETVAPQVWKRRLSVPADKTQARARATKLFGVNQWPLVKDDGKAEAALIALYGDMKTAADNSSTGVEW